MKNHSSDKTAKIISAITALALIVSGNAFLFVPQTARAGTVEMELFADDFNREVNSNIVGTGWDEALQPYTEEFEDHATKEQIRNNNNAEYGRFARLHGENTSNSNQGHPDHPKAAITHEIPSGGDYNALLTFRWRGDNQAAASAKLQVILGTTDNEPHAEYGINQGYWHEDEELELPSEICQGGGSLTFRSTANNKNVTVDIDDVRVTCEEEIGDNTISGYKWEYDPEQGWFEGNGWAIDLMRYDSEAGEWQTIDSAETGDDTDGYYEFANLPDGEYLVCEQIREGWEQTGPDNGESDEGNSWEWETMEDCDQGMGYRVEVKDGALVEDLDFRNEPVEAHQGTITGYKFYDMDRNMDWGVGESGIPDWAIALGRIAGPPQENGTIPIEIIALDLTGGSGEFEISGIPSGEYKLFEEHRDGWLPTTPPPLGLDSFFDIEYRIDGYQPPLETNSFFDVFVDLDGSVHIVPPGQPPFLEVPANFGNWQGDICFDQLGDCGGVEDICSDGIDNDEDGLIDLDDPDCAAFLPQDSDGDGVLDDFPDNCPGTPNEDQTDSDNDGIGDVCDDTPLPAQPATISGLKYLDLNGNGVKDEGEIGLPNWVIYIQNALDNPMQFSGDALSDESGSFSFDIPAGYQGHYLLSEQQQEGWQQAAPSSSFFDVFVELDGSYRVQDGETRVLSPDFGNRETTPPQSRFSNGEELDHKIIETELVSMNLQGSSHDNFSGVASVDLTISQVGGTEDVADYPSSSFFDLFNRIDCATQQETIATEIVALSLTSVDPLTVSWSHEWAPEASGIYCLDASAIDKAGNQEHTAWAGPVAYIPVPVISGETATSTQTNFTVNWTTNHEATSRVIYDTVSHASLEDAPNYGYASSTEEMDTDPMVTEHSVTVTGLNSAATYYYRIVSHGSPEAVSDEGSVTTLSPPPPPPSESSSLASLYGGSSGSGISERSSNSESQSNSNNESQSAASVQTPPVLEQFTESQSTTSQQISPEVLGASIAEISGGGVATEDQSLSQESEQVAAVAQGNSSNRESSQENKFLLAALGNILSGSGLMKLLLISIFLICALLIYKRLRSRKTKRTA